MLNLEWAHNTDEESLFLVSDQLKDQETAYYSSINDHIGMVITGDRDGLEDRYTALGGRSQHGANVIMLATSAEKSVLNDVVSKTIYHNIGNKTLDVMQSTKDLDARHAFFRDIMQREVKKAKDMLVNQRSATADRPDDDADDLIPFDFVIFVQDHQGHLHWASKGDIITLGINPQSNEVLSVLEFDTNKFTDRTMAKQINYGHTLISHPYLLTVDKRTEKLLDIEKFASSFDKSSDFDNITKSLLDYTKNQGSSVEYVLVNCPEGH